MGRRSLAVARLWARVHALRFGPARATPGAWVALRAAGMLLLLRCYYRVEQRGGPWRGGCQSWKFPSLYARDARAFDQMHADRMRAFPFAFAMDWSVRYRMKDVLIASLEASVHAAIEYDGHIVLQHAEAEAADVAQEEHQLVGEQDVRRGAGENRLTRRSHELKWRV